MELEGIDHIAMGVRDIESSAKWYIDVLGFERLHVVPGKMSAVNANPDARSWRKAYGLALSLFAVEVVLLYLFTVRFL